MLPNLPGNDGTTTIEERRGGGRKLMAELREAARISPETIMRTILAFYEIDRHYGGPEEGGWWYDTGTFVRPVKVCLSEAQAIRLTARANRLLDRLQRHRRPVNSVLYAGGRHHVCAFEGLAPPCFPTERPHYE